MNTFVSQHSHRLFLYKFITALVIALCVISDARQNGRATSAPPEATTLPAGHKNPAWVQNAFGKLPLRFEENRGQTDNAVRYLARGQQYTLYLTPDRNQFALPPKAAASAQSFALRFVGGATQTPLEAEAPIATRSNYFIGNDPQQWRTDVPNFARIRRRDVYPGVDVVFYGNQQQLEYDLVVAPQADPRQLRLAFDGAQTLHLEPNGDLLLACAQQQVRMHKPIVYQERNGQRQEITGGYVLLESESQQPPHVGFALGAYDPALPLIIDPLVEYSTFYGGNNTDIAYNIAVDSVGSVYVTGQTSSPNFPLKTPFDNALDGATDAFVLKLNPNGTQIVFASYIGGRNSGDRGWAIAVDRAGNSYFTGETNSLNFPTVNAAQPNVRGNGDAFVTKLNIDGNTLIYSTYLGGTLPDVAFDIALDRFDNTYVTGRTESTGFPVRNPLQATLRGQRDAFVTRYDPDGVLLYSTYLGGDIASGAGRDDECGYGIAVDAAQNIYVTGFTSSPTFPLANPIQANFGGVEDAFIAKIRTGGAALVYSTFLGGQRADNARSVAVDALGYAYITGYTFSSDFPTFNALQPNYGGNTDAFVAKLNVTGSAWVYSTYLGGTAEENNGLITDATPEGAIAVDGFGNAYVAGKTSSTNFPTVRAVQSSLRGDTDAFVAKLDPAGSELIYSSYLGSTFSGNIGFEERALGVAVDQFGNTFLTGQMLKSDFLTLFAVQSSYGGGLSDAFITKITTPDILALAPVSAASFGGAAFAAEEIVAVFGANLATGVEVAAQVPLPTTLLGASVKVKDRLGVERLAPLFFVSPTQINLQIPPGTAPGKAVLSITNTQNTAVNTTVLISDVAPGLFAANANGQGVAAAVVLRQKANGVQSFEPIAQLGGQGQLVTLPIDFGPESDQLYLILFGTGLRKNSALDKVRAQIGGTDVEVLYAGAQGGFVGQDQVNLTLPRSLAGRGEMPITLTVEGMLANPVTLSTR